MIEEMKSNEGLFICIEQQEENMLLWQQQHPLVPH